MFRHVPVRAFGRAISEAFYGVYYGVFCGVFCGALLVCSTLTSPGQSAAETPAAHWRQTRSLAAAEAVQAAAADARHVYAITNGAIGKYDRTTGRRLAVSTGPAQHLNSGFLWEGRLYCAHSNYPRQPEISDLRVLDPTTMELTVYRDFGDYGGSLTWAVRHDGAWWCNFARYGNDNHQTFLVRMDDDWQETGRWNFPAEMIRQLGSYSVSGGIWYEGELLTTDHDHGRLYRLRLPTADGQVVAEGTLELVDVQTAPFTGQGIAVDEATGGLVGIHRKNRQVLFAERGAQE